MIDISVGAVGAAIVAGLISILGLIIGKEQKISEFRQAWIDELRKCLVSYLTNINAVCDQVRLKNTGKPIDDAALLASYKLLNEASLGISLRINSKERPAKSLLRAMKEFEDLAQNNSNLTPQNILPKEEAFKNAAKKLLKFEWRRVKKGESTYVWTKRIVSVFIILMACLFSFLIYRQQIAESNNAAIEKQKNSQTPRNHDHAIQKSKK